MILPGPPTRISKLSKIISTAASGTVKIRLLTYDSHKSSWQRYRNVVRGTMEKFDQWYGPYPYAQLTVVDPPHGAGEAGGMEYPTFITGGTSWFVPSGELHEPEGVTEHEFGHQYWYGMVATNEFENAWLDEGINSYTEVKVLDSLFGHNTSAINMLGAQLGDGEELRSFYLSTPRPRRDRAVQLYRHEHGVLRRRQLWQDRNHAYHFGSHRRRAGTA